MPHCHRKATPLQNHSKDLQKRRDEFQLAIDRGNQVAWDTLKRAVPPARKRDHLPAWFALELVAP
jgi:hypothetical protein